jgi:hypothetical protein
MARDAQWQTNPDDGHRRWTGHGWTLVAYSWEPGAVEGNGPDGASLELDGDDLVLEGFTWDSGQNNVSLSVPLPVLRAALEVSEKGEEVSHED